MFFRLMIFSFVLLSSLAVNPVNYGAFPKTFKLTPQSKHSLYFQQWLTPPPMSVSGSAKFNSAMFYVYCIAGVLVIAAIVDCCISDKSSSDDSSFESEKKE